MWTGAAAEAEVLAATTMIAKNKPPKAFSKINAPLPFAQDILRPPLSDFPREGNCSRSVDERLCPVSRPKIKMFWTHTKPLTPETFPSSSPLDAKFGNSNSTAGGNTMSVREELEEEDDRIAENLYRFR
ncbi:MAG TPA: hypothetical protein VNF00_02525 [Candidatus Acidoferrales bacterium]|nr:hypothetical protein [Candidatus Acidoferrales bacterium]